MSGRSRGQRTQPKPIASNAKLERELIDARRRSHGRAELTRRHGDDFLAVSPVPGIIDEARLAALLSERPKAAAALVAELANATDETLRKQTRKIASQLLLDVARKSSAVVGASKRLETTRGTLHGEIQLDATLEANQGRLPTRPEHFVTQGWVSKTRSVCLLIDRSGSMSGQQLCMAAIAAGALMMAAGPRLQVSVIAFARESFVLLRPTAPRLPELVVDELFTLRGKGVTDISSALFNAATLLREAASERNSEVVLLSDAISTEGVNPIAFVGGLDLGAVHVIGTSSTVESIALGRALAKAGRGKYQPADELYKIHRALAAVLEPS